MTLRSLRAAVVATLLALPSVAALAAQPGAVLDVVEAPGAWGLREISGLAWAPGGQTLYAVSDRGRLWRLVPRVRRDGEPRFGFDAPPQRIQLSDGLRPNAEALAWRTPYAGAPEGGLLIADEQNHRALLVDTQGRHLETLPLPGPAPLSSRDGGVEAMDWHPAHGLLATLQRPPRGADRSVHLLHGADGRTWGFDAAAGRSSLKALEVVDDVIWVLEKLDQGKTHQTVLRRLTTRDCAPQRLCESARLTLADPRLRADDNFEGMACRPDGLCVLASDDGRSAAGRMVLLLLQLPR